MEISFDPAKRAATIAERGLDFAAAVEVFDGPTVTIEDTRKDYGEVRWITMGLLGERTVVLIWTQRDSGCRIISMRYAHERETEKFGFPPA